MPTYGVLPTGFVRKPLSAIVADLSASQRATLAATLNTSANSVIGQLNGIFARELGIVWEQLEIVYNANDPDAAEDFLLTMLAKLTGTARDGATKSRVTLTCNLDADTPLTAGTHFAALRLKPAVRWTPEEDFTAPGSPANANHDIVFVAENAGPIEAVSGEISVIATPVVGWNSVTNALDAQLGKDVDDDPTLRTNRERQIAGSGSTTARAIEAKVYATFSAIGLENAFVLENDTDFTDPVTGNPPHSIETLIYDGVVPAVANNDIAQIIWDNKAGGVQTVGNASGTAVINADGDTKTVYFSRATIKPVYVTYVFKVNKVYAGDDAVADYIAQQGNARFGPDTDVIASVLEALPFGMTGMKDVVSIKLGFSASPSGTSNLSIGLREVARFDTSRIVITSST